MSYYTTNLAPANSYYMVTKPFDVLEMTGHAPSNEWYGASRIYRPLYKTLRVAHGGVILNLAGGIFYSEKSGAVCRPIVLAKNDKSAFEKRYHEDMHTWPLDKLALTAAIKYVHKEKEQS